MNQISYNYYYTVFLILISAKDTLCQDVTSQQWEAVLGPTSRVDIGLTSPGKESETYPTWNSPTTSKWTVVNETFMGNMTLVAKSGVIGSDGITRLELDVTFTRDTLFTFWWKLNCQIGYGKLGFKINGENPEGGAEHIMGAQDWIQQKIFLKKGPYTLRWEYSKKSGTDYGTDDGQLVLIEEVENPCSTFYNLKDTCISNFNRIYCDLHVDLMTALSLPSNSQETNCKNYCNSYNFSCIKAWEDTVNSCKGAKYEKLCTAGGSGDQICRCDLTSPPLTASPIPTASPAPEPTRSPTTLAPTLATTPAPTPVPIQMNSAPFISTVVFLFACVILVTFQIN